MTFTLNPSSKYYRYMNTPKFFTRSLNDRSMGFVNNNNQSRGYIKPVQPLLRLGSALSQKTVRDRQNHQSDQIKIKILPSNDDHPTEEISDSITWLTNATQQEINQIPHTEFLMTALLLEQFMVMVQSHYASTLEAKGIFIDLSLLARPVPFNIKARPVTSRVVLKITNLNQSHWVFSWEDAEGLHVCDSSSGQQRGFTSSFHEHPRIFYDQITHQSDGSSCGFYSAALLVRFCADSQLLKRPLPPATDLRGWFKTVMERRIIQEI